MTRPNAARRQLIALDVDGTVLLEDGTPSPDVVEAVRDAVAAGHVVTLATGRSWRATAPVLDLLDIAPEFVVSANGATVYRRDDEGYSRFHTETFDPTPALSLLREHLPQAHYMVELGDGTRLFTEEMEHWNVDQGYQVSFDDLSAQEVSRVVVISPEHDEADFVQLIADIGLNQVSYAIGWTAWLDIAPQGVDKGTGLALVAEQMGQDPADTIVIGDGRNDLGMFSWARENGGTAVAMGQAPDEVRSAASIVTMDVERGGVAHVIRRIALGED
ncbi:Cof-type HAD-IIB family hydrolase [Microbacterium gorillae]|uniref:Cof-type HAD-IIB family hydrolase n=1 Tax=Microbacterium gorillae TaxID=1231063 RepID=UPI0005911319|nr:Cof-type HAD-IIB family hydrolase [Microbacterium gorillae]